MKRSLRLIAITLKNFRSYKESLTFKDLPQITILIGPNNVGKSNIIKALEAYREMAQGVEFNKKDIHSGNRSEPLTFAIEIELSSEERDEALKRLKFSNGEVGASMRNSKFAKCIRHQLEFLPDGNLHLDTLAISNFSGDWLPIAGSETERGTKFWTGGVSRLVSELQKAGDISASKENMGSTSAPARSFNWQSLSGFEQEIVNMLKGYLNNVILIPPIRQASQTNPGQDIVVSPTGNNLLRVMNSIQGEDPERFVAIIKEVYRIIPDLLRITAPLRGNNVTAVIREKGNVEVELDSISSGMQQVLILIISLLTRPKGSLVMVEEPEISLHASAQRALFNLMKQLSKDKEIQFIITSHSTIFTEISPLAGTFLVDKKDGNSRIRKLSESSEMFLLKQMLGHENTDLFGFNAVVIIEGESEERALPIIAKSMNIDFARTGIKLINLKGTGTSKRIDELLHYLRDSDTEPFLILDTHEHVKDTVDSLVRQNLISKDNVFIWNKDFEDCFDDEIIVKALERWSGNHNVAVSLSTSELKVARSSGKTVSQILKKAMYEQTSNDYSKPEMAEEIAQVLIATDHTATEPEVILKKIIEQVEHVS